MSDLLGQRQPSVEVVRVGERFEFADPALNVKRALVTGCSSGLGRALALRLFNDGWQVYATVRTEDRSLIDEVNGHHRMCVLAHFDVTDFEIYKRVEDLGRLDAVINNAGYALWGTVEGTEHYRVLDQFAVHVFGPLQVLRAALPQMRAAGTGHVINIGSTVVPAFGNGYYAASKSALRALTLSLATELRPFGVKVTLVSPGKLATEYARKRHLAVTPITEEYCTLHEQDAPERFRPGEASTDATVQWVIDLLSSSNPPEELQC